MLLVPHRHGPVNAVASCIDTLELAAVPYADSLETFWPRWLEDGPLLQLEQFGEIKPVKATIRKRLLLVGWRLVTTRPGIATIRRLDPLARLYQASVCRLDIAFDIQCGNAGETAYTHNRIGGTGVLKWRRPGRMRDLDETGQQETLCWVKFRDCP
jgi:hypothetical protein